MHHTSGIIDLCSVGDRGLLHLSCNITIFYIVRNEAHTRTLREVCSLLKSSANSQTFLDSERSNTWTYTSYNKYELHAKSNMRRVSHFPADLQKSTSIVFYTKLSTLVLILFFFPTLIKQRTNETMLRVWLESHRISTGWDDFISRSVGSLFVSADDVNAATCKRRNGTNLSNLKV